MNTETRTVAFQVPPELFEEFKAYLQRNHIKQKEFLPGLHPAGAGRRAPGRRAGLRSGAAGGDPNRITSGAYTAGMTSAVYAFPR